MRLFLVGFVVAAAGSAATIWAQSQPPPAVQPVAFDHAVHKKFDIPCAECHPLAEAGEAATFPTIDSCVGCHDEADTKKPEQQKLRALAAAGRPLEWVRVTDVPDHVLFSHRRHVAIGKVECKECHGGIEQSERPPEGPAVEPAMDRFCIACHERRGASTTCLACHR